MTGSKVGLERSSLYCGNSVSAVTLAVALLYTALRSQRGVVVGDHSINSDITTNSAPIMRQSVTCCNFCLSMYDGDSWINAAFFSRAVEVAVALICWLESASEGVRDLSRVSVSSD